MAKKIKIKYIQNNNKVVSNIKNGDWVDLRSAEDVVMKKNEFKLISLGVAIELPKGYEAHIVPRSSTYKNYGIIQTNGIGIIDNSYCGDDDCWFFPAYAIKATKIKKGDRICQFRIMKNQPTLNLIPVNKLGNKNRGGHGSTGVQ